MKKLLLFPLLLCLVSFAACGSKESTSSGPPPSMNTLETKSVQALKDAGGNQRTDVRLSYSYKGEDGDSSKSVQVSSTATDPQNANMVWSLDDETFLNLIATSKGDQGKECLNGTPKTEENDCEVKCKSFDYERNYAPSSDYCVDKEGTVYRFYFQWNKDFPAFKDLGLESNWEYLDYIIEEREVIDDIMDNLTGGMNPELRKAVMFASINSYSDFKKDLPKDFLAGIEGMKQAIYDTATVEAATTNTGQKAWKAEFHLDKALTAASLNPDVTGMVRKYYTESDDPLSLNNLDGIRLFLKSVDANISFDQETYLPLEAKFEIDLKGKALQNFTSGSGQGNLLISIEASARDYGEVSTEELNIPDHAKRLSLSRPNESSLASDALFQEIFGEDWGR